MLRRYYTKLLLLLAGGIAGFLLCEVVLRLSGYSAIDLYVPDPLVGAALRPHAEGWWTREGRAYIRINSQGLRDREHSKVKPANTVRLAVLGDSNAEALQLPMEQAFWAIAERRLQSCPALGGREVEAINFGVSGYGMAQELLTLRHKAWDYDPDIVLLAVTTENDISDASRALKRVDSIPYFVLADGQLVLDKAFLNAPTSRVSNSRLRTWLRWIRTHSYTVHAVNDTTARVGIWLRRRSNPDDSWNLAGYREPRDPVWQDAWAVTEALIARMRDEVAERRATFFVATLSGAVQVDPDPQVRQAAMQKYGITDFFYPDLRIKDVSEREQIPVLVLAPGLQRYAEQNHVHLHGFGRTVGAGHWNEVGHRVAGERIADWLCEKLTPAS